MKNIGLFKDLSEFTLFKLCEILEKKKFEKNSILFNDGSYRIELLSKAGKGFGLSKPPKNTDFRFLHSNLSQTTTFQKKNKGRSRISQLISKHIFKFNDMKFNRLKYPGLFIVLNGKVEIEDDRGFRCSDIISERDFFGENLII